MAARPDWVARLKALYFEDCIRPDGTAYWIEDACFELSDAEIQVLLAAGRTCEALVRQAIGRAMEDRDRLGRLGLNARLAELAQRSWRGRDPSLFGRLDFAWDGKGSPKLLEYNADTPTALYEAAVVQWHWLTERDAGGDQFNVIHERLVACWGKLKGALPAGGRLHIASVHHDFDCAGTAAYVGDCAAHAGLETCLIDVADIGLKGSRLVDLEDRAITHMFKLYPWEWLAKEDSAFFAALTAHDVGVLEPAWRAAAASKALLVDLWEAAPGCPYLLPTFREEARVPGERVGKPLFGRQGANVKLRFAAGESESPGPYHDQPLVWQARAAMPAFDGRVPIFGVWMIDGDVCGLGIREDTNLVTSPNANFIPHRIV